MSGAVIASIHPSPPRRFLALAVLGGLGAILLWAGLGGQEEGALGWRLVLIAMAGGSFYLAMRLAQASEKTLELTEEVLREAGEGGRVLVRVSEIQSVDRGFFAFKPSNGFMLRLSEPGPRVWAPGLWWRAGRRLGVGGVLRAAETRAVAEALSVMLAMSER